MRSPEGGAGFAFKLHQFFSQGGSVYTTIEPPDRRYLTLEGQHYAPVRVSGAEIDGQHVSAVLFPLVFCRVCGQEHYLCTLGEQFTHLLPVRDSRLSRTLRLFPPVALLLPIDALIACLARLFESSPIALQLGPLGTTSGPLIFRLTVIMLVPIAISLIAALAVARLWCAPQAIALEGCSPAAGLRRSWHLTRGQFGRVAPLVIGVSVLVALVGAIPTNAVMFATRLANVADPSPFLLGVGALAAKITQVLVLPVPPIVATLLYYDLRMRTEGYDLEVASRQTLHDCAAAKLHQGDLRGALADYERLREFTPNDPRLLATLVDLKMRLGELDGALADSERGVALFPNDVYSWNNRGFVRVQLGEFDAALADFNHALRGAPHDPMVLANRAHALHQRGDYEAARTDLFHALQFDPNHAHAMYNLACGYAKQGQPEPALDWLRRAIATDPHVRALAHTDPDFDTLRDNAAFIMLFQAEQL